MCDNNKKKNKKNNRRRFPNKTSSKIQGLQRLHQSHLNARSVGEANSLTRQVFMNPTSSDREIRTTLVDFFDYNFGTDIALAFRQYLFNVANVYGFNTASPGAPNPMAQVLAFQLWALPRFSNDNVARATLAVLYGLPVTGGAESTTGTTAALQTTILTPTSVSDWVKVGEWNEKTIDLTTQQPLITPDGNSALGTFVVVDPDDFQVILDDTLPPVQFMAKTIISQALPNIIDHEAGFFEGSASLWAAVPQTSGIPAQPLMVTADSVTKKE